MTEPIGKAVVIGVGGNRNPFVTITIEVKFKEFLITIGNSVRLAQPMSRILKNTGTVQFSDTVMTTATTTFSDLEHAVAIVGFNNTYTVPVAARTIAKNTIGLVLKGECSGGR